MNKIGAYMVPGEPKNYAWRIDAYNQEGKIVLMPCSFRIKKDGTFAKPEPLAITTDDLKHAKRMSYDRLAEIEGKKVVHFFLVRDSQAERTFAEIYALVRRRISSSGEEVELSFMETLREAVTEWVNTKEVGKIFFAGTSGDLNIGDLMEAVEEHTSLRWMLSDFGITYLNIESHTGYDSYSSYSYDTRLVLKTPIQEVKK